MKMKKILLPLLTAVAGLSVTTSCIEEYTPQSSYVTIDQAGDAPGSYDNFVNGLTNSLTGQFKFGSDKPWDYGYPSFFQIRDVQGQDISLSYDGHWYQTWYSSGTGLGPQYLLCQAPWTYYYSWIKGCNTVLNMAGVEPAADKMAGAGIAHTLRAMFYMDLARMFAQKTYGLDKQAETVPIITEATTPEELTNNPRATNEAMWSFILSDLDKAEIYLANYKRENVYTPDLSVVYGLKARAYLVMEDWANAEKYAKLAQNGYTLMSENEYTDQETGFNTPNSSWMFGVKYKDTDPNIRDNDADSSWGSFMCLEIRHSTQDCGYASNYGHEFLMDRHLYETIPATDFRKKCFVDFAIDEMPKADQLEALTAYTEFPQWLYNAGHKEGEGVGGLSLKFRLAGGEEGHYNQYIGFLVSVPLMRVEEMYLIEAEAAGMQNEANGIALLTNFAKTRDAAYVYGKHDEAYGNQSTPAFQNEIWWQRRVEFWGEGFATFDIKRLNKGIIRSYPNTNHLENKRWNTITPPEWMNWCIVQTETNYNTACTNNPTPIPPTEDSSEYQW